MGDLTAHFSREEFSCNCGCGYDDADMRLVNKLEFIRTGIMIPIRINSGCRCREYNRKIGGRENSAHTRGKAADIHCMDGRMRYEILRWAFRIGFRRIGVYKDFIHLDVDDGLPQGVVWAGK